MLLPDGRRTLDRLPFPFSKALREEASGSFFWSTSEAIVTPGLATVGAMKSWVENSDKMGGIEERVASG